MNPQFRLDADSLITLILIALAIACAYGAFRAATAKPPGIITAIAFSIGTLVLAAAAWFWATFTIRLF